MWIEMGERRPHSAAQFQYTASMPYHHTVGSRGFAFADLRTLLARASPLRSGDQLADIAAADTAALAVVAR